MDKRLSVNPDLQKERDSATFDVDKLTAVIYGGEYQANRRREIHRIVLNDKSLMNGPDYNFLSRDQQYNESVRLAVTMDQIKKKSEFSGPFESQWFEDMAVPWQPTVFDLHNGMFLPTIEHQATDEQKAKWLPRIERKEFIGTYAQTEMGHGTFLRGLETTATYDPKTEEFVIHSPTITALKWWPGGLGKTANCAVVMAQLHSENKDHGMFPFFVQLRDLDTHIPLSGVTLGDIGPKLGFNAIDNGFLKLDHVRIPRDNMLMKHAQVLRDGTFIKNTSQKKPNYSTMTMVRTYIVFHHGFNALATAMTIAIRYSAVRRQSELRPGAPEPQIMDFQTQQYKLYPYLAMAYGFWATANELIGLYLMGMGAVKSGDSRLVPELHALTSGLKAYCTYKAALGIEQARFSCGGHGYLSASGLPKLYTYNVGSITFEGENTVMELQSARYLMKCIVEARKGENLANSIKYLSVKGDDICEIDASMDLEALVRAFEHRARRIISETADVLACLEANGKPEYEARNLNGVRLVHCSNSNSELFVVRAFAKAAAAQTDDAVRKVMTQLCQLLAAYLIVNQSGDFLEDGYMNRQQLEIVKAYERDVLQLLRPNAVALVDAFDFPDRYLDSVLGRYDGNVYDNLYEWAKQSPLNKTEVHESYDKYLRPMMKGKL